MRTVWNKTTGHISFRITGLMKDEDFGSKWDNHIEFVLEGFDYERSYTFEEAWKISEEIHPADCVCAECEESGARRSRS